jgi:hypothetical protein
MKMQMVNNHMLQWTLIPLCKNQEEGSVEYSQLKLSNEKKGSIFKIRIKSCAEFIVLQSSLRQLLNQMQASSQGKTVLNAWQKKKKNQKLMFLLNLEKIRSLMYTRLLMMIFLSAK